MHAIRIATAAIAAALIATVLVPAPTAGASDWCGADITAPGTVVALSDDLHCGPRGITIRTSGVTIDLGGHTIFGAGSTDPDPVLGDLAGIMLLRATNTRILNGSISGFAHAVTVTRSTGVVLQDLRTERMYGDGIRLSDSTRIAMSNVTVAGVGPDAWPAVGVTGTRVYGFTAQALTISQWPDAGLFLDSATDVSISGSVLEHNVGDGINLWRPSGRIVIDRTVASDNAGGGIVIAHSSPTGSVTISHSTTRRNGASGIYTVDATNASIVDVGADDNASEGIWLDSGIDESGLDIPFVASIRQSTGNRNAHSGFSLSFAGRWTVSGNHAEGNSESGFAIWGGQATLSGNTSTGNAQNGYTWYDGSSGTSSGDSGTGNTGYGTLVATAGTTGVSLTDAAMTGNRRAGALISSGAALVTRGSFTSNRLEGIRVTTGGSLDARRVSAYKNGTSGISYLPGSSGRVEQLTASKNGRYGLCVSKGLAIIDVPPHILLSNGIAARGAQCSATIIGF